MQTTLCVMILIAATTTLSHAADTPLKVFILAGQSNMEGHADSNDLPADLKEPQKNVLMFDGAKWNPLTPAKEFGPEITFGQQMAELQKEPIGIIKLAIGGTNLAEDWSPARDKSLYAQLIEKINKAQKSRTIELIGAAWMQGERDSRFPEMANAYEKNLNHFIELLRKDTQTPNLIFIAGRVNPKFPYVETVRKAQESIKLPLYAFIDCDDLKKNKDYLHYAASGQIEMGRRFAAAMMTLLKVDEK